MVQLERNLSRARPDLDAAGLRALSRDAMHSYLRYWVEAFRLPRWSPDDVLERIVLHDAHRLIDAHAEGRGVVAALPHTGNWDLAGAWACAAGMPLTTVAERLRPESLYRDFLAYRASLGMEVLPLTGGDSTFRVLVERLRAGRFVPLLADRDLSRHGVAVDLLGEPASLPDRASPPRPADRRAAAADHLRLRAAGRRRAGPDEPADAPPHPEPRPGPDGAVAMTAAFAAVFSEQIRAHPADWHMLARLFLADLRPSPEAVR